MRTFDIILIIGGGNWYELVVNVKVDVKHSGPAAAIIFTSSLNEGANNVLQPFFLFPRNLGVSEISNCSSKNAQRSVLLVCKENLKKFAPPGNQSMGHGLTWTD